MEVRLTPELEQELNELAALSGKSSNELVSDAVAGLVQELATARKMLDCRYDDMKAGRVEPIDGKAFFESLRQREHDLLNPRAPR